MQDSGRALLAYCMLARGRAAPPQVPSFIAPGRCPGSGYVVRPFGRTAGTAGDREPHDWPGMLPASAMITKAFVVAKDFRCDSTNKVSRSCPGLRQREEYFRQIRLNWTCSSGAGPMMARPLASTATSRTGLISASLDTQLTCVPSASRERLPTDGRRYAEELSWPDGPAKPPGMSADGGRPAFGGCRQLWVPSAHLARVAERGAGKLQGRRARIGGGADLVPVQDVLA